MIRASYIFFYKFKNKCLQVESFSVDEVHEQDDDEALEGEEEEYVVEMEDPSDMQVRFFSFLFVNFRQTKILRD
jgi:hypothetical protein